MVLQKLLFIVPLFLFSPVLANATVQLSSADTTIRILPADAGYDISICEKTSAKISCSEYPLVWYTALENSLDTYVSAAEFWKLGARPSQIQNEFATILDGYSLCSAGGKNAGIDCVLSRFSGTLQNLVYHPHTFTMDLSSAPYFFQRIKEAVLVSVGKSPNRLGADLRPPEYATNSYSGTPNIGICPGKIINDASPGQPPHIVIVTDSDCKRL